MKRFIYKVVAFPIALIVFFYLYAFLGDGYSDEYYLRFTSPKQSAMILGISRAAQGIQPAIIDSVLSTVYPGIDMYNFAFSLGLSAYGPVYYRAIQQKLKEDAGKGVFILEVTPWSICAAPANPNDSSAFEEEGRVLDQLHFFNMNPNIDYLFNCYSSPYINLVINKLDEHPFSLLHNDGWFEIKAPMDSLAIANRTEGMIYLYQNDFYPRFEFSSKRLEYLEATIALLQQHGDVYLVRLPAIAKILQMEKQKMPQFDIIINTVAKKYNVPYYSFIDSCNSFSYVDGAHLEKKSGCRVSTDIANLIKGSLSN